MQTYYLRDRPSSFLRSLKTPLTSPGDLDTGACRGYRVSHTLGMKIKKSLIASVVALCVVAPSSGALQASSTPLLYPTPSADFVTTTTVPRTTAAKTFVWSSQAVAAGSKLKLSKVVSVKVRGTSSYRSSGTCSLRKGVLSFNRVGKCRVSVSVKLTSTGKVLRSSKVIMVLAKPTITSPAASGMPDPIGCVKASSHPLTGQPFPSSSPGYYELLTGWTCDSNTLDARPLLEYFKSQGWTNKSTSMGDLTADLYKGSSRASYSPHYDGMPEGKTLLMLKVD